jgi:hypothetical protein
MQLYQPTITGSLSVSGSINISGSINVVGGGGTITGTASYASNADTLDGAHLSVLATTSSNTFTGVQTVNSNLVVTGSITAQTLVVQTVTSSVVYSSGSNVFGNNIANTQVLTGSVTVTGSLAVVTNGTEFQVTSTGVRLGNISADTHTITGSVNVSGSNTIVGDLTLSGNRNIYLTNSNPAAGAIRFFSTVSGSTKSAIGSYFNVADEGNLEFLTGGTSTRMIISSSGNVGIGTNSPTERLDVVGGGLAAGNGTIRTGITYGTIGLIGTFTNHDLGIITNGTTKLFISASGNVGIGTSSPANRLTISNNGNSAVAFRINDTNANASFLSFNASNTDSAIIAGGTSAIPFDIYTGGVVRMTIAAGGTTTITGTFVQSPSSGAGGFYIDRGTSTNSPYISWFNGSGLRLGYMGFSNTNVGLYLENSAIFAISGNVSMARFSATVGFSSYTGDGLFNAASLPCRVTPPGGGEIRFGYNDYGGGQYWGRIGFVQTTNWSLGGIGNAGNDFSIGTGYQGQQFYIYANGNYDFTGSDVSDRRKKTNINYITTNQLDNILKLKPVTFNKIAGDAVNENIHTGFIAQDILESEIPNLVMGSDEGGYGLDYNGILALAVKAIQELKVELDELKNK